MKQYTLGIWLTGLCALVACSESRELETRDGGAVAADVTFHAVIRPLIEQHCEGCHNPEGIGPFSLVYDAADWESGPPAWVESVVSAVLDRRMPPWMPDPSCHELSGVRRLEDETLAQFQAWADGGFVAGRASDYVAPRGDGGPNLGAPSMTLTPAASYTPKTERPDDYRCFLLPGAFDAETYMVATNVTPGVRHEVHHVILYAVDEAQVPDAEALDAAEEGEGYTCFGGSGVAGAQNVGGWVPGMVPSVTPANSARVLAKGTRIVMQVHYNTSHAGEQGVHADLTRAELWFSDVEPQYRINTVPLANLQIRIPANESNSVQTRTYTSPVSGTLVGVLPHMHTRGKSIEVTLQRESADDMCLVRVPAWDFHWQQGYRYTDETFVELVRGDRLTLTCVYDNSGTDREVTWGEGTDDEMCLNYLEVRTPFAGNSLAERCPSYHECIDGCGEGDSLCVLQCTTQDAGCQDCTGSGLARCAVGLCQDEGLALQGCLGACAGDAACSRQNCAQVSLAFFACMEPHVRAGSCDAALESCGN